MIATVTLNPSLDEWLRLPSLHLGHLNRATGFARYPGGKGLNVSRVIHELGGKTLALALAGGEDGAILETLVRRLGIPHEFVSVAGSTRNNYKILTARPAALTEINAAGPAVSSTALLMLQRRLLGLAPRARCAVLSGSLPPGVPASTYARWIGALRRRGIPSVLDASGEALRLGRAERPWLMKPNQQEAEELLGLRLGRVEAIVDALPRLLRGGPDVVILSRGADGALLATAAPFGVWVARPPTVPVDSAVGAGDSLVGGFLAGWARGRALVEAFRLGVASGTAAAMTPGTKLCRRADVRRILPRVVIRRLA